MKVFAFIVMTVSYLLTGAIMFRICRDVAIGHYLLAFLFSILGAAAFFTAEILKKELRQGRI
jgi:Na+-transporting NADH:ubiquinone oxidoreductase subunit NqrB